MMNREAARAELQRLAHGLTPDSAGAARLLERISATNHPETLRAILTEDGAHGLLVDLAGDAA